MISRKIKQNKPSLSLLPKKKAKMSYKAGGERRWYFVIEREIHPCFKSIITALYGSY